MREIASPKRKKLRNFGFVKSVKIKSSEVPKRREERQNGECVAAQFEEIPMLLKIAIGLVPQMSNLQNYFTNLA